MSTVKVLVLTAAAVLLTGACGLAAEAGHTAAAGHAAHADSSGMWWNLLFRTMNFAGLVALLFWLLRKPVGQMMRGRRETIKAELEDLERAQAEAEQKVAEAEAKLEDIQARQEEIIQGYLEAGEAEKDKIITAAEKSAVRIREMADMAIAGEIKKARADLMAELSEMSAKVAEDLIKKNIGPEDQKRLVGEYLEKVKAAEA